MKLLRLKVVNYRGINTREVKFSPLGITRIEGPNESGKSSLGEAINTILDYPDNSKKQDILSIQPVHQDVGPEIELELETGRLAILDAEHFPIVRHWYIVHRKNKRLSGAAQAFKQFLLNEAEKLTAPDVAATKQRRETT